MFVLCFFLYFIYITRKLRFVRAVKNLFVVNSLSHQLTNSVYSRYSRYSFYSTFALYSCYSPYSPYSPYSRCSRYSRC